VVPTRPKIYHIVHLDRLPSIVAAGQLWSDTEVVRLKSQGTGIGMTSIKQRRLTELLLNSHPDLHVGECVPFYFCPRSIMLYLLYRGNDSELDYKAGQEPIIHLEADLYAATSWADNVGNQRWAFTLSNAGARYFEDRSNLAQLHEIDWNAVQTNKWSGNGVSSSIKEGKQAEFLMEMSFPWHLIERIGVYSNPIYQQVANMLPINGHRPHIEILREWYY